MNHISLLALLFQNRELLDSLYKKEKVELNDDNELIVHNIVNKKANKYKLNYAYEKFVDIILLKADYSTIFGDYNKHIKELIKRKKEYSDTKNSFYLQEIEKIITELIELIYYQSTQAKILIDNLTQKIDVELDILINEAKSILEKLTSLQESLNEVNKVLTMQLLHIHETIDTKISQTKKELKTLYREFIESCDKLSELIRLSQKQKLLNQKLFNVAHKIMKNHQIILDNQSIPVKIKILTIPQKEEAIPRIVKEFQKPIKSQPKKEISIRLQKAKTDNYLYLNIEKIRQEIIVSEDLFKSILHHDEIKKFDEKEHFNKAFNAFLLIVSKMEHLHITQKFNEYNIKVVTC